MNTDHITGRKAIPGDRSTNPGTPQYGPGYNLEKKKERRRMKVDNVIPDGEDDGTAGKKMILAMVDEVLEKRALAAQLSTEPFPKTTEKFERSMFFEKLDDPHMKSIPTQYEAARQKAIWPNHSSEKRKRMADLKKRLIRNDGGLVRLRLGSEGIDDSLLKFVSDGLHDNIYLQHIMLQDNAITDGGLEALCQSLKMHPSINTIWIGGNQISDNGARYMNELLIKNPNLKDVNISNKWPRRAWGGHEQITHPHISAIGAEMFARTLMTGSSLTALNIADQRICDPGAVQIFRSLKKSQLRTLNLKSNKLTDKCCKALKQCLQTNPPLEELKLACNEIKDGGCLRIVGGLNHNKRLFLLDLERNKIGEEGLQALAECMLKNNVTIASLNTGGNVGFNDDAENIANTRRKDTKTNSFGNEDQNSISSADYSDTDSEESRSKSPNARYRLGMNGRRPVSRQLSTPVERSASREAALALGPRGVQLSRENAKRGIVTDHDGSSYMDGRMSSPTSLPKLSGSSSSSLVTSADESYGVEKSNEPKEENRDITKISSADEQQQFYTDATSSNVELKSQLADFSELFSPSSEFTFTLSSGMRLQSRDREGLHSSDSQLGSNMEEKNRSRPESLEKKIDINQPWRHTTSARMSSGAQGPPMPKEDNDHQSMRTMDDGSLSSIESHSMSMDQSSDASSRQDLKSQDVGRTLGVPYIGQYGVMPIRSATSRHRDSGQHLMYLRIQTPADPPDAKPYSLLQVAKDREGEIKRVKLTRQDPEYKIKKRDKMAVQNQKPQAAALKPPPAYFWESLRRYNRVRYNKGIDNTVGCTSTKFNANAEGEVTAYNMEYLQQVALAKAMGKDGPTLDDEGNKIINVTSKGQALTLLRQRNKIKRDFNKMQNEKQEKVEEMRERNFILNKEMPMRVVLTEQNDTIVDTLGFLLSKSSILPPIEAEKHKKKLKKEAYALKQDAMFDDDDYDPDKRVRLINPRILWGKRHLCEDGTMPVASFMDKSVELVREEMGFNKEAQEAKRKKDEEKERARKEEEERKREEAIIAENLRILREKEEMERIAREKAEAEALMARREAKRQARLEAREAAAREEAEAREKKKQEYAAEMARREAQKKRKEDAKNFTPSSIM